MILSGVLPVTCIMEGEVTLDSRGSDEFHLGVSGCVLLAVSAQFAPGLVIGRVKGSHCD